MKKWFLGIVAVSFVPVLFLSCQNLGDGDDPSGQFDTIELFVGPVPPGIVSVDWELWDSDLGYAIESGTIDPLDSNQSFLRYSGRRRSLFLILLPIMDGGTPCAQIITDVFSTSDPDQIFLAECPPEEAEVLIIYSVADDTTTHTELAFSDYGMPDEGSSSLEYYPDSRYLDDMSVYEYSIVLTDSGTTKTWTVYSLGTPRYTGGQYWYDSSTGVFEFRDEYSNLCAVYRYDSTYGSSSVEDFRRILTLDLFSTQTCAIANFETENLGGIWFVPAP